jgi:hypothetical protein
VRSYTWISGGKEHNIKYHLGYDLFSGMYTATLLGGEFDNTYGHGKTEKDAVESLKLRLIQLRNKIDKKFENYNHTTDVILPPVDNDVEEDGDDGKKFRYDFKICGLRYDIRSIDNIEDEIKSLNWDSNGVVINKFDMTHGKICFKVNNFYKSADSQYLMIDAYYSIDDGSSNSRLNIKEFNSDVASIIYQIIEHPFRHVNSSSVYYENWQKEAWLEL